MYVGSDGRVVAKRSLSTYFTWPEIKRLFWELINVIILLFATSHFFFFFFVFTPQDHRHIIINFLIHSFKSIFKPDAVAEAENRRRHGYGGPGFTTSGSSSGHGGDHGSGGPARRPMGRINHSCLFDVLTPRTQSPSKSPFLNPDSVDELPDKRMRLSPHLCVCARRCAVPRVPVRRARHATEQSVHERQVRTQHTHTH